MTKNLLGLAGKLTFDEKDWILYLFHPDWEYECMSTEDIPFEIIAFYDAVELLKKMKDYKYRENKSELTYPNFYSLLKKLEQYLEVGKCLKT